MGQVELPHSWRRYTVLQQRNAKNTKLLYKTQGEVGHLVEPPSGGKFIAGNVSRESAEKRFYGSPKPARVSYTRVHERQIGSRYHGTGQ